MFILKVHPSSLSIEGTLGNFKLCDKSLDSGNCWSWLCDIRDPGVESLIKVSNTGGFIAVWALLLILIFLVVLHLLNSYFTLQFKFNSYSAGDDDYEGYDYSLSGRLSAVRIVFLYRFVQEVPCSPTFSYIVYFMRNRVFIKMVFFGHFAVDQPNELFFRLQRTSWDLLLLILKKSLSLLTKLEALSG